MPARDQRGAAPDPTDLRVTPPAEGSGPVRGDDGPHGGRGTPFTFRHDGRTVTAYPGETIGAALLAAGVRALRPSGFDARPRGLFCGIGACFDCLVTVDGDGPVRACLAAAAPDTEVEVHDVPRQR